MLVLDLIELSKRKNAAHKDFLRARGALRGSGGSEMDRNVRMDYDTREQREAWENLSDEWLIALINTDGAEKIMSDTRTREQAV